MMNKKGESITFPQTNSGNCISSVFKKQSEGKHMHMHIKEIMANTLKYFTVLTRNSKVASSSQMNSVAVEYKIFDST